MRIAFLTGSTHGIPRLGGEARIFHLAKHLASLGIEVDLFGSRFDEDLVVPPMSQNRSFEKWSGGDWYPISIKSLPVILRNAPSLVRQGQMLRRYDAAITELGTAWQLLFSRHLAGLPTVLDEHNVEWDLMRQQEISTGRPYPWRRLRIYEKICHAAFDYVLAVSALDKANFQEDGTPGRKVTVVSNGVDTISFKPDLRLRQMARQRLRLGRDTPVLMYMGSMKFFPNQDAVNSLLSIIYPRARTLVPEVKLILTGPGTGDLPVSMTNGIIQTGVIERGLLPSYINSADICLAPLRFGSGTRFKILEWMACGKVVVATRKAAEGIEVTHGSNIILEDAVDAYPARISELFHDDSFRMKLGSNAREFVERNYDWKVCMAPLEGLLKRL